MQLIENGLVPPFCISAFEQVIIGVQDIDAIVYHIEAVHKVMASMENGNKYLLSEKMIGLYLV